MRFSDSYFSFKAVKIPNENINIKLLFNLKESLMSKSHDSFKFKEDLLKAIFSFLRL